MRSFDSHQPFRVKTVRGEKEKLIQGTIVAIKGPETYLVRVPGKSDRRFLRANHLIPDAARKHNQSGCEPLAWKIYYERVL